MEGDSLTANPPMSPITKFEMFIQRWRIWRNLLWLAMNYVFAKFTFKGKVAIKRLK